MSIDQSGTMHNYVQIWQDLVEKIQSITDLRASTWTNHMRVFSHSGVRRLGLRQLSGLTGVIENNVSTARSTFARAWVNAHTDARTRFVIADRPQTIVWAFTLSSRTSIWRFMAIWPSVESLFSITPLPYSDGVVP